MIKVGLPGESLWARVKAVKGGKISAELRSESIHDEFSWGDLVVLGDDNYTVVDPAERVASVQQAIEDWRASQGAL
jgi:hypothetical protein